MRGVLLRCGYADITCFGGSCSMGLRIDNDYHFFKFISGQFEDVILQRRY